MDPLLANVHRSDQSVFEGVEVHDHAVEQQLAGIVVNDLMHLDRNSPAVIFFEADRVNAWIEQSPLPSPISADTLVSVNNSTFHAVGPNNIGFHRGNCSVDVARVEGRISSFEQFRCGG